MGIVVKATGRMGNVTWLSPPDSNGFRSLVPRERAHVFPLEKDARAVIAKMPPTFEDAGIVFSTEPAEPRQPLE